MNKKVLSVFLAVCMLVAALPTAVFAKKTATDEIDEAIKAVKTSAADVVVFNDMTMDEFLKAAAKVLPEDNTCTLSFEKESDYRIWNATSEKAGGIFANILFTSSYETPYPVTRHEMYDFKIAQLTGDAAAANVDVEKLAEDRKNVSDAYKNMSFDYTVTEEKIVEMARAAVKNGTTVESAGDFTLVEPTVKNRGSVKLTLNLTLNNEKASVKVSNVVRQLEAAPAEDDTKTDAPADNGEEVKEPAQDTPVAVNFGDVKDDDYFAAAVKWAVEKNVTTGTSATTFSPNDTCTRAQIITFMWRANGSPKIDGAAPFGDVTENDYYYEAAKWAAEKGMVETDNFDGNTPCTRASTVVYMWQAKDEPTADTELASFDDVSENAAYAEAVAWAVENGVTSGTSATTFSPDDICSRGQIVTFLNRALAE